MNELLRAMARIALLRQDPSVLPGSIVLVVLTGAIYAVLSAISASIVFEDGHWFGRMLLDLALTLSVSWFLLAVTKRGHRFRQTIASLFGTAILLAPLMIALEWLLQYAGTVYLIKLLAWAALFVVVIWSLLIVAHILKSALEIGYVTSTALALTWFFLGRVVMYRLFPAVTN